MAPLSFREATASKRLLWLLTEKLKLGLTSERHESIHEVAGLFACLKVPVYGFLGYRTFGVSFGGMWPLLVSKLRGLGVSLGLPLARPSFSGPESVFGCEGGVVLFGAAPERNGARLA